MLHLFMLDVYTKIVDYKICSLLRNQAYLIISKGESICGSLT